MTQDVGPDGPMLRYVIDWWETAVWQVPNDRDAPVLEGMSVVETDMPEAELYRLMGEAYMACGYAPMVLERRLRAMIVGAGHVVRLPIAGVRVTP